ncbi:hypothetical protein MTP99_014826 [Tenebrio molitor]|nr:hypothetical protein MTP99_014826 [Tenebrio molitor]
MLSAIEQYQTQKISFSVHTSYLDWKTNFPSIVLCEKSNEKMDEANDQIFGTISEQLPKLEHFVFFDGTMTNKEVCLPGGKLRDTCILGNYSEYMRKFRSTCSEVIGSCYYNNEKFPCCDEFLPIGTYHGPCLAFNSLVSEKYSNQKNLPFKITRNLAYGYGNLSVELFHAGFFVYGLSQDAVPTRDSSSEFALIESSSGKGITDDTYYKTFLAVKESFTDEDARLMNVEHRGCRFYDENNLRHSKVFSMSACENECLVEAQLHFCNCTAHTLPHIDQIKDCDFDGLLCVMGRDEITPKSKTCNCTSSCFDVEVTNIGFTKTPLDSKVSRDRKSVVRIDFIVQSPTIRFARTVVKTPLSMLGK